METILITGVAGFIGSKVAERFINEGYSVIGVDDLSTGHIKNVPKDIDFIEIDLSDYKNLKEISKNCSSILHLAGQSSGEISFDNPVADLNKNTVSTLNLIKFGIDNNIKKILYASSMSIYGHASNKAVNENDSCLPLSCYGVGKLASENYLKIYQDQLPFVSLRMFNVYGPGQDLINLRQGMVSIYIAQAIASGRIEVKGNLNRFRDFIYIDDVVEAWFRSTINQNISNTSINVGTGIKTTIKELLDNICTILPNTIYFESNSTPGDQNGVFANNSFLKECLSIKSFTSLDEGLKEFVKWARNSDVLSSNERNL
jgi:UDP-glucose 4-epimerase